VRILLWHGWLLEGSGSNIYTARTAEAFRRAGHDVVLLCQQQERGQLPFVDAWGTVGEHGVSVEPDGRSPAGSGRLTILRPQIGPLLPVFVVDEYPGFQVKAFPSLTDQELEAYLRRNDLALRAAAAWHHPDAVIVGHAVPGGPVARRALGPGAYVVKIHGSDLEYAIRVQRRYLDLAAWGVEGAVGVAGATREVIERATALIPTLAGLAHPIPPGVQAERFLPRPRDEALEEAARRLEEDGEAEGRPDETDALVRAALADRDAQRLDSLALTYDQSLPDRSAPERLRALSSSRSPLVGYLGKLIAQKGPGLLIQAVALLPSQVGALIVGFGRGREWLAALLAAMDAGDLDGLAWLDGPEVRVELGGEQAQRAAGLAERITFTGRLDHRYAPQALAAMDVLVVPSILEEAFGMVAAEGAAAGALPLVARHSGLAEVAGALEEAVDRPGLFSYQPGPGSVGRIARGLDLLLDIPPAERAALGGALSSFVRREWTWDHTSARLLEIATPRGSGRASP
jgi:glycosyltransferase involved in cell wall biosynthesis